MQYNAPYGVSDPNAPYVNGDPSIARAGSIPPAASIEYPQREIVQTISDVALAAPTNADLTQLSHAVRYMRPQFVLDRGAANNMEITLDPQPAGWNIPLSFFVEIGVNNTNTSSAVSMGITGLPDTRPVVKRSGQPPVAGDFVAGSVYLFTFDGLNVRAVTALASEMTLPPGGQGTIQVITTNTDYYVNPATGNDANDGSAATPWQTLQHAYNWVQRNIDLAGNTVTYHCADGTYNTGVTATGIMRGQTGAGAVVFQGNGGSPSNCLVQIGGGTCFFAQSGAKFTVNGFEVTSTGNANLIGSSGSGSEVWIGPVIYGSAPGPSNQIVAGQNGSITVNANYAIVGGASAHIVASGDGSVSCIAKTITLSNTPNYAISFANAQMSGSLYLSDMYGNRNTYIGPASGAKYSAYGNGVIFTDGGSANYLPGSIGGSVSSGGQYI